MDVYLPLCEGLQRGGFMASAERFIDAFSVHTLCKVFGTYRSNLLGAYGGPYPLHCIP